MRGGKMWIMQMDLCRVRNDRGVIAEHVHSELALAPAGESAFHLVGYWHAWLVYAVGRLRLEPVSNSLVPHRGVQGRLQNASPRAQASRRQETNWCGLAKPGMTCMEQNFTQTPV